MRYLEKNVPLLKVCFYRGHLLLISTFYRFLVSVVTNPITFSLSPYRHCLIIAKLSVLLNSKFFTDYLFAIHRQTHNWVMSKSFFMVHAYSSKTSSLSSCVYRRRHGPLKLAKILQNWPVFYQFWSQCSLQLITLDSSHLSPWIQRMKTSLNKGVYIYRQPIML